MADGVLFERGGRESKCNKIGRCTKIGFHFETKGYLHMHFQWIVCSLLKKTHLYARVALVLQRPYIMQVNEDATWEDCAELHNLLQVTAHASSVPSAVLPIPQLEKTFIPSCLEQCQCPAPLASKEAGDKSPILSGLFWIHKSSIPNDDINGAAASATKVGTSQMAWYKLAPWWSELAPVPKSNPLNPIPAKPLRLAFAHPTDGNWVGVPRFWGMAMYGVPQRDKRFLGDSLGADVKLAMPLRPLQLDAMAAALKSCADWGGAFLQADCGFGKTPTALGIIAALGRKALFVCNRSELMRQAMDDIVGAPSRWPDGSEASGGERQVCKQCLSGVATAVAAAEESDGGLKQIPVKRQKLTQELCAKCGSSDTSLHTQTASSPRNAWLPGARVAMLRGQWEPDKRGRKEKELRDADIIVCCINSLAMCAYPSWLLESVGTVVIDEAHHIAAATLSQALPRLPARNIVALSATPNRSDGLERVLFWLLGPRCFVYERTPETTGIWGAVNVSFVEYEGGPRQEIVYKDGRLGFAAMTVALSKDAQRNALLVRLGCRSLSDGRARILMLTSFVEHLQALRALFANELGADAVGILHGTVSAHERTRARGANVKIIVATYSFIEEGYDDDTLDTLILATPRSRVQQSVGRIERTRAGKAVPLVLDIVDTWSIYARMRYKRRAFYKSRGFSIESK
jgi:superfamily II DNA or RNA helicase